MTAARSASAAPLLRVLPGFRILPCLCHAPGIGAKLGLQPLVQLLLALILAPLIIGCKPAPEVDRLTLTAFGTLVDITLYPGGTHDLPGLEQALLNPLSALHQEWHAWSPGALTTANQALTTGDWFTPTPDIALLVARAQVLEQQSNGLFNPAIGALVAAWGFHQDEPAGPPPTPDWLAEFMADPPRMALIEYHQGQLRGHHPRLQLDFGGIAKGLALLHAVDLLHALGVEHAVINAGGDLFTLGQPRHRPWRVGIRNPLGPGVLAGLELGPGEAVFTSGTYERGYLWNDEHVHHVLDPRTGRPSQGLSAVTVVNPDPILADAAATALLIAGPDAWPELAWKLGLTEVLVVLTDGSLEVTPALKERLRMTGAVPIRERALER